MGFLTVGRPATETAREAGLPRPRAGYGHGISDFARLRPLSASALVILGVKPCRNCQQMQQLVPWSPWLSPTPRCYFARLSSLPLKRTACSWSCETLRPGDKKRSSFMGRRLTSPRLTAWYGDEGSNYIYSGIKNVPLPWTSAILEVKRAVETCFPRRFNSVLLNRYRTGKDSVSWHADDEPEFGEQPVIASVSFGATRTFQFKHKKRRDLRASVALTHGSLLIMRGGTQANWVHQVPKVARPVEERLNLTFRAIIAGGWREQSRAFD